jgi:hypothetical protein
MTATSTATGLRFIGPPETVGENPKATPLYVAMAPIASASIGTGHVRIMAVCSVGIKGVEPMSDEVLEHYARIVDVFKEMRDEMYRDQRYAGNLGKKTDALYNAIRDLAPHIGAVAPYLPIDDGFGD